MELGRDGWEIDGEIDREINARIKPANGLLNENYSQSISVPLALPQSCQFPIFC